MLRRLRICAPVGLSLLLLPAMAYALDKIDGKPVPEWQVAVDTVWPGPRSSSSAFFRVSWWSFRC